MLLVAVIGAESLRERLSGYDWKKDPLGYLDLLEQYEKEPAEQVTNSGCVVTGLTSPDPMVRLSFMRQSANLYQRDAGTCKIVRIEPVQEHAALVNVEFEFYQNGKLAQQGELRHEWRAPFRVWVESKALAVGSEVPCERLTECKGKFCDAEVEWAFATLLD